MYGAYPGSKVGSHTGELTFAAIAAVFDAIAAMFADGIALAM